MAKFYKASDFLIVSLIDKPIFSVTVPAKTITYIAAKKPKWLNNIKLNESCFTCFLIIKCIKFISCKNN